MRAQISIYSRNIEKSVAFYRKLFGVTPQKQTEGYAKFDLQKPALNFSMQSGSVLSTVAHFGIEVDSIREVEEWTIRLSELGLIERVEKGVNCCYARQDKVWLRDPDGNSWEIFHVLEQLPIDKNMTEKSTCCA